MLIIEPKFFAKEGDVSADQTLMNMQKTRMAFLLAHQNAQLTDAQTKEISEKIEEDTGIIVGPIKVKEIFNLYPVSRIAIAHYGTDDTTEREEISFVVANFFGSTNWPTFGDKVNIKIFIRNLQQFAVNMGYKLAENSKSLIS